MSLGQSLGVHLIQSQVSIFQRRLFEIFASLQNPFIFFSPPRAQVAKNPIFLSLSWILGYYFQQSRVDRDRET